MNCSRAQTRLFIGNIPKDKDKDEIAAELNEKGGKLLLVQKLLCETFLLALIMQWAME